jgi:hypothetical protein
MDDELYDERDPDDKLYDTIHSAVSDALSEQPQPKQTTNPFLEAVFAIGAFLVLMLVLDYLSEAEWINKFRYSAWYSVDSSQVIQTTNKPPSDCDFLRAPIGLKGCHYEKKVEVQEATQENGGKKVYVYWEKKESGE